MQDPIDYRDAGPKKAPSVVFLHGLFFDSFMWAPHIETLSHDYYCVAMDLEAPGADGGHRPFTVETLVNRLERVVKKSKAKKPVLCGHGLGGYVALRALERKPEGYSGIILCDAHPGAPSNPELLYWAGILDQLYETDAQAVVKQLFTDLFAESSREEDGSPFDDLLAKAVARDSALAVGQIVATMSRTDTSESLEASRVPKLLVTGQDDRFAPPEAMIDLGLRISGAQFVRVPDTGHAAPVEHPTLVLKALNRFLNEVYNTRPA
ncbi:MAG: alpha/beta fold hydrolase [Spirochaetota bacterium]